MSVQELLYEAPAAKWRTHAEVQQPWELSSGALTETIDIFGQRRKRGWRDILNDQLNELVALERGWDGVNSGPVSVATALFTANILHSVMTWDTPIPTLVPAHGGALQLEWHERGLDIELMVYRPVDAELTVHFDDGRDSIEEAPLTTNFDLLGSILEELVARGRIHPAA